ncbi:tumor necrosis factor ligand superfamily member 14-like [Trachinotus anak]|uniref:tumor necrosis factor ligand superfamily member 14-like n=1 Tax=Trachinotus anak TaxID=443729 RepID=UPI0039F19903
MTTARMAEDACLSVRVVRSLTTGPLAPGRPGRGRLPAGGAHTLLLLLVSVALCGVVIEACFIYRLYQPEPATSASSSKLLRGEHVESPGHGIHPSKPAAHLSDGPDVVHAQEIMAWSMTGEPLLYDMAYKDRTLIIQKEGYYYVYSKVFFLDKGVFHHSVNMKTERYSGGSITLLQSRKYSPKHGRAVSNSYLGGVFHLYKDNALYVKVSNTTYIERHGSFENVFGAFMI